jgi:Gpi18-like mannosyltransferase
MIGLLVLNKYLQLLKYSSSQIFWLIIFLNVFPSSFFFGALYNTSLFFGFVIASLYFSKKKQFVFAGLSAILASVTRLEGIFLVIVFILPLFFFEEKIPALSSAIICDSVACRWSHFVYGIFMENNR